MSETPMCTWCGSTGHTLVDCLLAPTLDEMSAEMSAEGLKLVDRFRKMENGEMVEDE